MDAAEKLTFCLILIGIMMSNIFMCNNIDTLTKDRTSRVTEINHIAYIEHFYGNLPTGEIRDGDNRIPTFKQKK